MIDPARALSHVARLAAFGTRHALSPDTGDDRGAMAAARWLEGQFKAIATASQRDLRVEVETFEAPPMARLPKGARLANVVAVLPGKDPAAAKRAYYVVGHYDSRNADALDGAGDAPGANDDASGVAVVLECATALAQAAPLDATVVFLCTSGEEAGLVGARRHAQQIAGVRGYELVAALNNDIVGDPSPLFVAPDSAPNSPGAPAPHLVRVFSEGLARSAAPDEIKRYAAEGAESDSPSRQLARYVAYVATREGLAAPAPMLVFRADRFLRGGDHTAFNEAGYAAVRFSTPAEDYSRQHVGITQRDGKPYGDLAAFCDGAYIAGVARLNAAVLMHLASAPRPPARARIVTAELETGTTLRWDADPEGQAAGYEVVWRSTTSPDWTGSLDVGMSLEARVALSKDNVLFGVRAYDREGFRSPVAFCWSSKD